MPAALALDYRFDDRDLAWYPFGRWAGFTYRLLHVGVERRPVDMLFKFEPDRQCFHHRHVAPARPDHVDDVLDPQLNLIRAVSSQDFAKAFAGQAR